MQARFSTKGQVVLPGPIRRRLDIRAGDPLDANIEKGRIVLTPQRKRAHRVKLVTDPVTAPTTYTELRCWRARWASFELSNLEST
jgi:AbrB family looped-hinge helix DNA binding protein